MEDPDVVDGAAQIGLDLDLADGTDKNSLLFDDFALTTPATASTTFTGHVKMVRDAVGRFSIFMKIPSTETPDQLTLNYRLQELSVDLFYSRNTVSVDEEPGTVTLVDSNANKTVIAKAMKDQDVSATGLVSGSIQKVTNDNIDSNETKIDTVDGIVDLIKLKTDNLPADPASETNVNANETKIDALDTKLGTPAGASVSADIAAVKVDSAAILVDTTAILLDTAEIGTAGAGLTDLGGMSTGMKAEVEAEANDALVANNLDHLMKVAVTGADVVDNSAIAKIAAKGATADWDTFANTTDSLEAIRDRGDAAWSSASMNPVVLQETTIATLASQTSFTLTVGGPDDDVYNKAIAVITDSGDGTQKAVAQVLDYAQATKTITLKADPGIFTMAVGDSIAIIAVPKQLDDLAPILADTAEMQPKLPTNNIMGSAVKTDKDDEIDTIKTDVAFLKKLTKNKREFVKSAGDFFEVFYDDDSTTPILNAKVEKFGTGPIGELLGTTTPSIRNKSTV